MTAQKNATEQTVLRTTKGLGLAAPHEVLFLCPKRYCDYTRLSEGKDVLGEDVYTLHVTMVSRPSQHPVKNYFSFQMETADGVRITGHVFGKLQFSPWRTVQNGERLVVHGMIKMFGGRLFMTPERVPDFWVGRIRPVYKGVPGRVSAEAIETTVQQILRNPEHMIHAVAKMRREMGSRDPGEAIARTALMALHAPRSPEDAEKALLLARKLSVHAILASQDALRVVNPDSQIVIVPRVVAELARALPFPLSESQREAVKSIVRELGETRPARHLLSGDVGSGKTAAYLLPAAAAHKSGAKVAIMMPNTLLAEQVFRDLRAWWPEIPAALVTAGETVSLKDNPMIVGTTAIISRARRANWVPDVLVLDEQQKLSREQRDALTGPHTNVIEATATCIPRTAALVAFGAMSVSTLEPHVEKTIHSKVVDAKDKQAVFQKLREIVDQGGRIACIYPLRSNPESDEGAEDAEMRKTVMGSVALWEKFYPGKVATLHGGMDDAAKAAALESVRDGRCPILISTTVIEVGITIPELRALMVVHAERYGVSTLHQMRGRVARNGGEGWFFMYLPDRPAPEAMQIPEEKEKWKDINDRLELLERESSGHKLAELDMNRRGFGDLASDANRQHGKSLGLFRGLVLRPEDFQ